jgi:hypothetical protein
VIFINQIRDEDRRDVRLARDDAGRAGAEVLQSVRIDIRRIGAIKDGDERSATACVQGGQEQGGAAVPRTEFDIMFDEGISADGRPARPGGEDKIVQEERRVVQLRRCAPGPGPREPSADGASDAKAAGTGAAKGKGGASKAKGAQRKAS